MTSGGLTRGFVGRGRDLGELLESAYGAAAGHGGLVMVGGEAGMGKTRLCQELTRGAGARGLVVAWAGCSRSEVVPAFWLWSQLLRQLAERCSDLEPELIAVLVPLGGRSGAGISVPSDPDLARLTQFDAVASLLTRATRSRPAVLVIDDLHWADVPSIRLLTHLAPLLHTIPVLVVATYREFEVPAGIPLGDALADLGHRGRRLGLAGLTEDEVAELITVMTGSPPVSAVAAALHHQTGGNPLFAREVVRLRESEGTMDGLGDRRGGRPLPAPTSVRDVLSSRLWRLSSDCRELLAHACVVGDEFGIDLLAELTGTERAPLLDLLGDACASRLIHEMGIGRYAFAHALVRATLYEQLGVGSRVRLHERVGTALESLSNRGHAIEPAALAHHFAECSAGGGASKAVRYSLAAAARAMELLAYEDSARLYSQALAALALNPSSGDRVGLLLGLGESLRASGDAGGARQAHLDAAELARSSGRAEELAHAALGLGGGGGFEITLFDRTQVDLLEEALTALGSSASALRALVMGRLSVALSLTASVDRRLALSVEALMLARASGDGAALAHALAAHCDAIAGPADSERRLTEAAEMLALAERLHDRRMELLARRLRVVALLEVGDIVGADREIDQFSRVSSALRQPLHEWYVPLWHGMRAAMEGRMDRFWLCCAEAEEVGRSAQSPNAAMLTMAQRIFALIDEGRGEAALELTEHEGIPDQMLDIQMRVAMALVHASAGHLERARGILDGTSRDEIVGAPVDSEWLAYVSQLAEIASLIGGHPLAEWLYEALTPHAHRFVIEGIGAYVRGSVERQLGLLAGVLGRREDAIRHFDAAVSANQRIGAHLPAARALEDSGRVLDDTERLARAGAAYRQLGITARVDAIRPLDAPSRGVAAATSAVLRRDGEVWTVGFAGDVVRVRDVKGLHTLAQLVSHPGREFPALDLVGARSAAPARAGGLAVEGDLGEVLDAQAREEYRVRLAELETELSDADAGGDAARSARARRERDVLIDQLSAAYGLGGRPRRAGDPAERARVAATWRIRTAIARIESGHPGLGRHLRRSVRTGTFCMYDPVQPVEWEVS